MKSARKENKFSNLTDLFQNLADEKNRQKAESATINLARQRAENGTNESKRGDNKGEEDKKDENDKKNKCFRCDRSSYLKEKCSIVNFECIECHKIDH
jgi:hypothetical protein